MNVEAFSSQGQKLKLKEPTGWFVAGESFRRALLLLSDGAFKMFAYLCLQADRRTARVETTHRELAQALGKSKRAIGTYVGELEKLRICRAHAGRNQFARTVFEIEETYWPYDRLASGSEPTQERTYIELVRQAFLGMACGSGKFTSADAKTAGQMEADGIPLEIIQDAVLLGSCRKYISWLNGGSAEGIGSLRYFVQIVIELRRQPISADYRHHLRAKAESYAEIWRTRKRPLQPSPGGYPGMGAPEIVQ
jgi:hypothetical protein